MAVPQTAVSGTGVISMTSNSMPKKVIRTERGWAGHFICANRCLFRRNTLLQCGTTFIVVSTVGAMRDMDNEIEEIGYHRYYETMAFHSDRKDKRYHDMDVKREIRFDSPRAVQKVDADDKANDMHETVVKEITESLLEGKIE